MTVSNDFFHFKENLAISSEKRDSISRRYQRITKQLNKDFYESESEINHSRYVGSYGRKTATSGFSDLDMLFQLPYSDYLRFNNYNGNGQSALLSEFRDSIRNTYPTTNVSGDGQVLVINFEDNITFEILPAFENNDGSFTYPDSNDGGRWRVTDPIPEIKTIQDHDIKTNGNLKDLAKMARAWKNKWDIPMGGLLIDTLAYKFLLNWQYAGHGTVYYDWMSRDFFDYLQNQDPNQDFWYAVGSNQKVFRKGPFEYKAKQCHKICLEAIEKYKNNHDYSARLLMREVYGNKFPN